MIARRSFLAGMLALGAAPAIVRAGSLMRIAPQEIFLPSMVFPPAAYEIWTKSKGAILHYTTDGSTPTMDSPFVLSGNKIIISGSRSQTIRVIGMSA